MVGRDIRLHHCTIDFLDSWNVLLFLCGDVGESFSQLSPLPVTDS